jgi:hypothetical protein
LPWKLLKIRQRGNANVTRTGQNARTNVEIHRQVNRQPAGGQPQPPMEHAAAAPPAPGVGAGALAASLKQIIGFFDAGMLTEAEFAAAKATVLGLATPPPAALVPEAAASAAASPMLATVLAEELTEPVLAAVVVVQATEPQPTLAEDVGGCVRKKKKEKRKRDDAEDDPTWLPGGADQANGGGPAAPRHRGPKAQGRTSKFTGVCWDKTNRNWKAAICHDGRPHHLGCFAQDEEEAARAFDEAARRLRGAQAHGGRSGSITWRLNFPTGAEVAAAAQLPAAQRKTSKFTGVRWHRASRKWLAAIRHDGRSHHLGSFAQDKEEDAARAFDEAALRLRGAQAYQSADGKVQGLNFPTATTETRG